MRRCRYFFSPKSPCPFSRYPNSTNDITRATAALPSEHSVHFPYLHHRDIRGMPLTCPYVLLMCDRYGELIFPASLEGVSSDGGATRLQPSLRVGGSRIWFSHDEMTKFEWLHVSTMMKARIGESLPGFDKIGNNNNRIVHRDKYPAAQIPLPESKTIGVSPAFQYSTGVCMTNFFNWQRDLLEQSESREGNSRPLWNRSFTTYEVKNVEMYNLCQTSIWDRAVEIVLSDLGRRSMSYDYGTPVSGDIHNHTQGSQDQGSAVPYNCYYTNICKCLQCLCDEKALTILRDELLASPNSATLYLPYHSSYKTPTKVPFLFSTNMNQSFLSQPSAGKVDGSVAVTHHNYSNCQHTKPMTQNQLIFRQQVWHSFVKLRHELMTLFATDLSDSYYHNTNNNNIPIESRQAVKLMLLKLLVRPCFYIPQEVCRYLLQSAKERHNTGSVSQSSRFSYISSLFLRVPSFASKKVFWDYIFSDLQKVKWVFARYRLNNSRQDPNQYASYPETSYSSRWSKESTHLVSISSLVLLHRINNSASISSTHIGTDSKSGTSNTRTTMMGEEIKPPFATSVLDDWLMETDSTNPFISSLLISSDHGNFLNKISSSSASVSEDHLHLRRLLDITATSLKCQYLLFTPASTSLLYPQKIWYVDKPSYLQSSTSYTGGYPEYTSNNQQNCSSSSSFYSISSKVMERTYMSTSHKFVQQLQEYDMIAEEPRAISVASKHMVLSIQLSIRWWVYQQLSAMKIGKNVPNNYIRRSKKNTSLTSISSTSSGIPCDTNSNTTLDSYISIGLYNIEEKYFDLSLWLSEDIVRLINLKMVMPHKSLLCIRDKRIGRLFDSLRCLDVPHHISDNSIINDRGISFRYNENDTNSGGPGYSQTYPGNNNCSAENNSENNIGCKIMHFSTMVDPFKAAFMSIYFPCDMASGKSLSFSIGKWKKESKAKAANQKRIMNMAYGNNLESSNVGDEHYHNDKNYKPPYDNYYSDIVIPMISSFYDTVVRPVIEKWVMMQEEKEQGEIHRLQDNEIKLGVNNGAHGNNSRTKIEVKEPYREFESLLRKHFDIRVIYYLLGGKELIRATSNTDDHFKVAEKMEKQYNYTSAPHQVIRSVSNSTNRLLYMGHYLGVNNWAGFDVESDVINGILSSLTHTNTLPSPSSLPPISIFWSIYYTTPTTPLSNINHLSHSFSNPFTDINMQDPLVGITCFSDNISSDNIPSTYPNSQTAEEYSSRKERLHKAGSLYGSNPFRWHCPKSGLIFEYLPRPDSVSQKIKSVGYN